MNIQFALPVQILKEGSYYIAYSPVLDISTSAKTFEKAQKRFVELVEIFFEEIMEKGTLDEVLSDLGWQKIQKNWTPPTIISHESQQFKVPLTV